MEANEKSQPDGVQVNNLEGGVSASSDEEGKTPHKRKRPRKDEERPPTPTEGNF